MAIAEHGLDIGRIIPRTQTAEKPKLYSQKEINKMMLTTPPDLEEIGRVVTPIGTWHMDGKIVIFDSKPTEEIDRITKPSLKKKFSAVAKVLFQIS